MIKRIFTSMFNAADMLNRRNILSLASGTNPKSFLDLGCDDGKWTKKVAAAAGATNIYGIEIIPKSADYSRKAGVQVTVGSLDNELPYDDMLFDLVHSNQVIEHVSDIDKFTSEAFRVLKPGGTFIVSTENGSSWHNIFAAMMGWQIFSLTNLSKLRSGVGNPLAIHKGQAAFTGPWTHKVIFNYQGLKEFLETHGFTNIEIFGAGYYPFPAFMGRIDPRHAHFITAKAIRSSTPLNRIEL